jgi:hypothetical protein
MLVDDEPNIRKVLAISLEAEGTPRHRGQQSKGCR